MKIPQMVLSDYGQTLMSAEQVQAKANEINGECGRFDPEKRDSMDKNILTVTNWNELRMRMEE